jgi:CheY-like chemotaxis protein
MGRAATVRQQYPGPILIVNDDADTLDEIAQALTEAGYAVVCARDGQEGIDLFLSGVVPTLLMIDLAMPRVAGDDLLRYVQADPVLRFVPVLVVTGAPERAVRVLRDRPKGVAASASDLELLSLGGLIVYEHLQAIAPGWQPSGLEMWNSMRSCPANASPWRAPLSRRTTAGSASGSAEG